MGKASAWGMVVAVIALFSCGPTDPPVPIEPPPSCAPATCAEAGAECGAIADGCGGVLECGGCSNGESCGGGGAANVCGTACAPVTCEGAGKNCGTMPDGCGGTVECGTCGEDEVCGGGAGPNVCGPAACEPTTCEAEGAACGSVSDGCSGTLSCGSCAGGERCTSENQCVKEETCLPTTCAAQGKNCGTIEDGCGGALDCGTCANKETCGGAGEPNVCAAQPPAVKWSREWSQPVLEFSARELADVVVLQRSGGASPTLLQVGTSGENGWSHSLLDEGLSTHVQALEAGKGGRLFVSGATNEAKNGSHYLLELASDASEHSAVVRGGESTSFRVVATNASGGVAWIVLDSDLQTRFWVQVRRSDGSTWRSSNQGEWWFGSAALAADGSLAIAGRLMGMGTLGDHEVRKESTETVVVAVLEPAGAVRWVHTFPASVSVEGLGTTATGEVIAAVFYSDKLTWGVEESIASRGRALLMASADGSPAWLLPLPPEPARSSSRQIFPFSLAVSPDAIAIAVGEECSVGIWRLGLNAEVLWKRDLELGECTGAIDADVDLLPDQEVIVGGQYRGTVAIEGQALLGQRSDPGGFLLNLGQ